jgi:hypothetical protein
MLGPMPRGIGPEEWGSEAEMTHPEEKKAAGETEHITITKTANMTAAATGPETKMGLPASNH